MNFTLPLAARTDAASAAAWMARLAFMFTVLAAGGCADLKAVKKFSDDTTTLGGAVALIVQDTPETCRRRLAFDTVIRELSADRQAAGKNVCDDIAKSASAMGDLNAATIGYAKALASLADDKVAVYTSELDGIKASVAQLKDDADKPYVDKEKADAAASLADLILKAFTEGYRQSKIREMLGAHDDLARQAEVFKRFIDRGYLGFLTNEEQNVDGLLLDLGKYAKSEPLRARELSRDLTQHKERLKERREGAQGTRKALDEMVTSHKKLRDNASDLTSKDVFEALDAYASAIKDVRKKFQAAF